MNISPKIGIGVLIFNKQNQILLGKRINSHGMATWGPPGGNLEFGESFEECAIRETREETALLIDAPRFLSMTNDFFESTQKHYISIFMTANMPSNQNLVNLEPDKIEEWIWFDLVNLPTKLFLPLQNLISGKGYESNKLDILKNHLRSC